MIATEGTRILYGHNKFVSSDLFGVDIHPVECFGANKAASVMYLDLGSYSFGFWDGEATLRERNAYFEGIAKRFTHLRVLKVEQLEPVISRSSWPFPI